METASPKILVVDDDVSILDSCKEVFESRGYQVQTAIAADTALEECRRGGYDVVITDLMMPGLSGMDFLRILHEEEIGIPTIMITGYATVKTAIEAMRLGAFDYLPKPFEPEELAGVVSRALKRSLLPPSADEQERWRAASKHPMSRMWDQNTFCSPVSTEPPRPCPPEYYSIAEHSWVKKRGDEAVLVGIHDTYLKTLGEILSVDLPRKGDILEQGKVLVRIVCSADMLVHSVWAPVSGEVTEVNELLNTNPELLEDDPYNRGWVAKLHPTNLENDLANLTS